MRRVRRGSRRAPSLPFAIALLCGACKRGTPDADIRLDLIALFPFTEAAQQGELVDLGSPVSEAQLASGWSREETLPTGEPVAWAEGQRATVQFAIHEPAARRIVLRCAVPSGGGLFRGFSPVSVRLNGRPVRSVRLGPSFEDVSIVLPIAFQRRGRNALELTNPFPHARQHPDGLSHSIACNTIRLVGPEPDGGRHPEVARNAHPAALVIPASTHVDFFVRLPPGAALVFDPRAPDNAHLRVSLATDRVPELTLFDRPAAGPTRLDLTTYATDIAKLSFAALGEGEVRLLEPRILGREVASRRTTIARARTKPNVLLYVIDTLRADHLGCYGYSRPTSPHIDALAATGIRFEHAVAQSSWTTPATASILTGRYPFAHGATNLGEGMWPDVPTLAEALHGAGYRTAAFVTNGNVAGELGFARGFETYHYFPEDRKRPGMYLRADELHARILPWLAESDRRPFFLYVHATDPHAPYLPPEGWAERFQDHENPSALAQYPDPLQALTRGRVLQTAENVNYLVSQYDAEVAFLDESIGQFLTELGRLGLSDDTLVVLVADHGEEFHDHGRFSHGRTLYGEVTYVPLIIRLPRGDEGGQHVTPLARQIDILPTVLAHVGVPVPDHVDGRALLSEQDGASPERHEAFSQTNLGGPSLAAVEVEGWKIIENAGRVQGAVEVYDLGADPRETHNLADGAPVLVGYGEQRLAEWRIGGWRPTHRPGVPRPQMDGNTRERLRALGYVD